MEFTYTVSVDSVKLGAKKHYWHRYKGSFVRSSVIMLALVILGAFQISQSARFGFLCLFVGLFGWLFHFIRVWRWPHKTAAMVFHKDQDPKPIKIKCDDSGLFVDSQNSSGHTKWDAFYEVVVLEEGILLYISKALHMWIPVEAEFAEGDWNELCSLLEDKVVK